MIDFHTHILPGMDDGSKSVEMSLAMLRMEAAQGVGAVALTLLIRFKWTVPRTILVSAALGLILG